MESSSIELCRSKQVVELNGFPEHTNLSALELSSIYPWAYTGENFCAPLASKIYPRRYPTDGSKGNG